MPDNRPPLPSGYEEVPSPESQELQGPFPKPPPGYTLVPSPTQRPATIEAYHPSLAQRLTTFADSLREKLRPGTDLSGISDPDIQAKQRMFGGLVAGPVAGLPTAASGAIRVATGEALQPGLKYPRAAAASDVAGGLFESLGLAGLFMGEGAALPTITKYGLAGEAAKKTAEKTGVSPEVGQALFNVAMLGSMADIHGRTARTIRGVRERARARAVANEGVIDIKPMAVSEERVVAGRPVLPAGYTEVPPPAEAALAPEPPKPPSFGSEKRAEIASRPEGSPAEHVQTLRSENIELRRRLMSASPDQRQVLEQRLRENKDMIAGLEAPSDTAAQEAPTPPVPEVGQPTPEQQLVESAGLIYKGEVVKGFGGARFEHPLAPGASASLAASKLSNVEGIQAEMLRALAEIHKAPPSEADPLIGERAGAAIKVMVEKIGRPMGAKASEFKPGEEIPRDPTKLIRSALPPIEAPREAVEPPPVAQATEPQGTPRIATDRIPGALQGILDRVAVIDKQLSRSDLSPAQREGFSSEKNLLRSKAGQSMLNWSKALGPKAPEAAENLRTTAKAFDKPIDYLERHLNQRDQILAEQQAAIDIKRQGHEQGMRHAKYTPTGELIADEAGAPLVEPGASHAFREATGKLLGQRRVEVPDIHALEPEGPTPEYIQNAKDQLEEAKFALANGDVPVDQYADVDAKMRELESIISEHERARLRTHGRPTKQMVAAAKGVPTAEIIETGAGLATGIEHGGRPVMTQAIWERVYGGAKAKGVPSVPQMQAKLTELRARQTQARKFADFLEKRHRESGVVESPLAIGLAGGGLTGAAIGGAIGGPPGAVIGGVIGMAAGGAGAGITWRSKAAKSLMPEGITIEPSPKDMGFIARYFGSLTQQAGKINPAAGEAARIMATVARTLEKATSDSVTVLRRVEANLPKNRWDDLVKALDDPDLKPDEITDPIMRESYDALRALLDNQRQRMIHARRLGDEASGFSEAKAKERTPDDWGIQEGYFPHVFVGDWSVLIKEEGRFKPIEAGWRQITRDEAVEAATQYKKFHPEAELRIDHTNIGLPTTSTSNLKKLREIASRLQKANELSGAELDEAISELSDRAEAAAYGPGMPRRSFRGALPRHADLKGWARDPETFEASVRAAERYIAMVVARPKLLQLRNQIAKAFDAAPIQRISEMPRRHNAKILGALDAAIEVFEGYPNRFEAAMRAQLGRAGLDPQLFDKYQSRAMEFEALMKLGFSPVSALVNLTQTTLNTYPVLGEKWTAVGLRGHLSGKYADLLEQEHVLSNLTKIESGNLKEYLHEYRPRAMSDIPGAAHRYLRDSSLWMFNKAERANRAVAFIGAYERAKAKGLPNAEARSEAHETVGRTQFNYEQFDRPAALRGLPKFFGQFKTFAFKEVEFAMGLRGVELARFLLVALPLLGVLATPGLELLDDVVETVTGESLLNKLKTSFGGFGARLLRGIPGLLGVDITRNVGFTEAFSPRVNRLAGPFLSDAYKLFQALPQLAYDLTGHPPGTQTHENAKTQFLRGLSPEATRFVDAMKDDDVLRDPLSGAVLLRSLTPMERALMFSGLTPIRIATERDLNAQATLLNNTYKDRRAFLVNQLANALILQSSPGVDEETRIAAGEIFNKRMEEAIKGNLAQGLKQAVRDRLKQLEIDRGMRNLLRSPRSIRPEILNLYEEGPSVEAPQP